MSKRGIAHVEMIAAFALFFGFLLFGLYYFNPTEKGTERVLDTTLFYAKEAIIDNVTSEYVTYSLVLDDSVQGETITLPSEIDTKEFQGLRIEDRAGNMLPSFHDHSQDLIVFDRRSVQEQKFIVVRGGMFTPDTTELEPGKVLTKEQYTISSSQITELPSEVQLNQLSRLYMLDYESVRQQFNLPRRVDFGFSVHFDDGTSINSKKPIPEGLEVVVQSYRQQIVREDGTVQFADLAVSVW